MNGKNAIDELLAQMFTPRRIARPQGVPPQWTHCGHLPTVKGSLAYWSIGAGPTVLLVHGWEGAHGDLDAFVEPLVEFGHRVVTFDHLAHGESDGAQATLFDAADGVRAMAERFGPFAGIVAHSVGCPATAMALQAGVEAERVALIASPTRYEEFVRAFSGAVGVAPSAILSELKARDFDIDALDLPRIAATLDTPALLIHSDDDRVTSSAGTDLIARAWRRSKVVHVDGLGHNRILRDIPTIARVVEFISL